MTLKRLLVAVPAALFILANWPANAGQTINDVGAIACVNDKWDEKEVEKGHKLVDYAGRCVTIPDDSAAPKKTLACVGKYEYMPDESWKASGTCTHNLKGGDKYPRPGRRVRSSRNIRTRSPAAPENTKAPSGGGTYTYENLTDTLSGGTYKGQIVLP